MFTSSNLCERALAWQAVGDYHGFDDLDSYPLTFKSRAEVEARYAEELAANLYPQTPLERLVEQPDVNARLIEALEKAAAQFDFTVKSLSQGHTVSIRSLQNCAAAARLAIAKVIRCDPVTLKPLPEAFPINH
jgi:hypothetical protein